MLRRVGALYLCLLLMLTGCTTARASTQLESRLSNLEVDVSRLRNQMDRLESQLLRGNRLQAQPQLVFPRKPEKSISPTDAMFDRLATLVIELKERVNKLEVRLSKLEAKQQ